MKKLYIVKCLNSGEKRIFRILAGNCMIFDFAYFHVIVVGLYRKKGKTIITHVKCVVLLAFLLILEFSWVRVIKYTSKDDSFASSSKREGTGEATPQHNRTIDFKAGSS